jgi:hypothetical protein
LTFAQAQAVLGGISPLTGHRLIGLRFPRRLPSDC